jgi:hypothetical protein
MLSSERLPRLIHREVVQLVLLVLIAIGAFILTRSVAAANRDLNRRDAAAWFADGQRQLSDGHLADAVASVAAVIVERSITEATRVEGVVTLDAIRSFVDRRAAKRAARETTRGDQAS